ncbi:DEAD/DEAH box helicase [Myroides sp. LJL115]
MKINKILQNLDIQALNAMQQEVLKQSQTQKELVLLSPTGSGKTLAFLLPLIQHLERDKQGVQAICIVPTRELALQIEAVFKAMKTPFKVNTCYGGHSVKTEMNNFSTPSALLIGTPGRLKFHIEQKSFDPSTVTSLVIDEFDKALELGFTQDMDYIINSFKNLSFKILTSATKLSKIPAFTQLKQTKELDFLHIEKQQPQITYSKVVCKSTEKLEDLIKLLAKIGKDTILIFCNHRDAVDRISQTLAKNKVANSAFHGGLLQEDRQRALMKFKNGSCNILISTDLGARGLDIPEIGHVIHYQMPQNQDTFIHRNGRTARMKAKGKVYLILSELDNELSYIDQDIPLEILKNNTVINNKTDFQTIYISAGKKDKINKVDIVGYLIKTAGLTKEDIGLIDLRDNQAFIAIKSQRVKALLTNLQDTKIKNKKVKIALARN